MPFGPLPAMVVPNALDFSPINNAIQQNRQNDLALNKLAMEQERLGFERELQPFRVTGARQETEQAGAMNPLRVRELQSKLSDQDKMFPLQLRQAQTATEVGEENQDITRQYRREQGFAVPNAAARLPTTGAATAATPDRSATAGKAADLVENFVLGTPDEAKAKGYWDTFTGSNYPELAKRWQQHVQAFGTTGDWKRDASDFVRDMRHEANGTVLKPMPGITVEPAGPVDPSSPAAAAPTATTQPAPAADGTNRPLYPSIGGAIKSTERMAVVPGMGPAAEAKFKILQGMVDKGFMPTVPGSRDQVMPMSGTAESNARSKGMEKTAELDATQGAETYKKVMADAGAANELAGNVRDFRDAQKLYQAYGNNPGAYGSQLLDMQKLAVRLGFGTEDATAPGELMRKIGMKLATGFASGTPGFSRITQSELQGFSKSVASIDNTAKANDYILAAADRSIELRQQLASLAINYKKQHGILDAGFDAQAQKLEENSSLRSVIQQFNQEPEVRASAAKEAARAATSQAEPLTKEKLLSLPDGPVLNGKYIKRGGQLIPVEGESGTVGNPFANKTDVQSPGQHAFENGKVYRRTPNLLTNRWEEVQ